MKNRYNKMFPVLKDGYSLQRGLKRGRVFYHKKESKHYYDVNESAARILEQCNGKKELEEITSIISSYYDEEHHSTLSVIKSYLDENRNLIDIYHEPVERNISISGSWDTNAPTQVSIELTYNCNFFCRHCYIESGPERKEFMDSKKLIQLLKNLVDNGVFVIEITGGEPLLHPDFLYIVEWCAKRFPLVSILTNGYVLNEDYITKLIKYKENVIFQVNLTGNDSEYVDWFCDKKGAFKHAKDAIKLLSKNGFMVRASMLITPKNIDQVFDTASLAKELGAMSFLISPIIQIGRGQLYSELSYKNVFTSQNMSQLTLLVENLENKFGDFIFKNPELMESRCGAGNTGISITPTGDVKLCPMADPKDFPIGNVFTVDLNGIFSKLPVLQMMDPSSELCGDCRHRTFCGKCVAMALKKYHEIGEECSWGKAINISSILEELKE